jgi:hypothetical protein
LGGRAKRFSAMENVSPRDRVHEDSRATTRLRVSVAGNGKPWHGVICSRFPAIPAFPKSR